MATKPMARLIAAAEAYGDAKVCQEAAYKNWNHGDPIPDFDRSLLESLKSAARAYATSTRKNRP